MRENIHKTLASIVKSLFNNPPISLVILAPECGGIHRIRLFSTQLRSRATNYCWPDLVITQNGEVRVILEIEDAGIVSPGRIGGKLLPVSLSTCLLNEEIGPDSVEISEQTAFIQVVNTASLQPTTRKLLQYENLEADTRRLLPLGCVARFFLFPIAAEEQPPYDAGKYDALLWTIHELLAMKDSDKEK